MLGISNLGNNNNIILKCARRIEALSGARKTETAKVFAMHLVKLKNTEVNNLPKELGKIAFFPAEFNGRERVYAPNKIALACDKDLVSLVLPFSDLIPTSTKNKFVSSLQFLSPPPLANVLNNWIALATNTRTDINVARVLTSLHPIMMYCHKQLTLDNKSVIHSKMSSIPCIWTGTGFLLPS